MVCGSTMTGTDAAYLDHYDEAVVEQLEEGTAYKGFAIKRYYKRYTTIQQDKTAKQRAKNLTESPCFESEGVNFRFMGVDNE